MNIEDIKAEVTKSIQKLKDNPMILAEINSSNLADLIDALYRQAFKDYLMEKADEWYEQDRNSSWAGLKVIAKYLTPDTVCPECNRSWFSNAVPEICFCGRRLG